MHRVTYTAAEYTDMILIYGECCGNAALALRTYRERYGDSRNCPRNGRTILLALQRIRENKSIVPQKEGVPPRQIPCRESRKKSLAKICSSDVFRVVSTNDSDCTTRKMNGRDKNAAAVKTERPISPSCSEDDDGPGPVGPFKKFLGDSDQYLSTDLSNSDEEQTKIGYRNKKLNKKIKVEIQPNLGDFTMSSSNDELSPNILKDDTPRLTPVPSTSTDASSELPPAHNPTQTALSEFHSALIREVQKHPCLYDHMNPSYHNVLIKGHIWVKIGKTIGSLETTCQSEWSNIQDAYVTSFNNPSIPYLGPDVRFLDRYITNQEETVIAPIDLKAEDPLECEIKTERDDEEDEQSGVFVPVHKKRKIKINLNNTDVTTEMAPKIESIVRINQEAFSISQKIKQEQSDLGDFTMSSSNDELSPNITKDDTPRLTPVPSTSTDASSELPPAHNPTQTALSEFHSALIREVQKHPCLYDHLNPAYDNVLIKGHIWVEIGKTIGSLETTCQSEWSNIQDAYVTSFNNPSIPYLGPDVRFLDRYIINQEETVIAPIDIKAEDPLECEIKTERDDEEDEQSGAYVTAIGFTSNNKKIVINLNNTDVTTEMAPKIECSWKF